MGRASSSRIWLAKKVAAAAEAGHTLAVVRCLDDGSAPEGYALNRVKANCECGWTGRVKRSKEAALMSAMTHLGDLDAEAERSQDHGVSVSGSALPAL